MASPRRLACPVALILAVTAAALLLIPEAESRALTIRKRAAFYIANDTVCNVDGVLYQSGDPIPTEDPCETCKCRPPGFACTLRECDVKPHCKAVRREGQCCPEYHCGCEQEGKLYKDGEVVPSPQSPCYVCYCQGSSITCSLVACQFRGDCEPRYVDGECCPRYDHCPPTEDPSTTTTIRIPWSRASSPRTTGRFFTTRFQPTVIPGAGFSTHVPSKATDGGVHVPRTTFPAVTDPTRHIDHFSTDQTAFPPSLYDDLSSPQPVPDITNPVKRFTTHLPLPDETEARSAGGTTVVATETDSTKPLDAGVQSQDVDDKLRSTASKEAAGASAGNDKVPTSDGSPNIIGAALVPIVPDVAVPAAAVPALHVPTVALPDATVPVVAPVVTAHVVPTIPIHSVGTTSFSVGGDTGSAVHTTITGATVPSTSVSGAGDGVATSSGPVLTGADHSGASETAQADQAAPGGATHTDATTVAVSGGSTLTVGGSDAAAVDTASHDGGSTSAATATSELPSDVSSTGTATDYKQTTTTVVGAANNGGGTTDVQVDTTVATGGQADTATQPESTSVTADKAAATPDAHPSDASGATGTGDAHDGALDRTTSEVDTGAHTLGTTDAAIAKETTNAPSSTGDSSDEPGQTTDVTSRKSSEESAGEESHLPPSPDATTSTQQPSDAAGSDSSTTTTAGVSNAAETDHPATGTTPGVTAEHSSVSDVTTGGLSTGAHDDQSAATTGAAHDSDATPALSSDASGSSEASPPATESSTGTESADANKGDAGSTPGAVSSTEASSTTPEAGSSDQDTKTGSESGGAEPTTPSAAPVTSAPDVAAPAEKAPEATSDSEPTSVKPSVEGADVKTTTAGLTVSDAGSTTQVIESSTPSSTENAVSGSDEASARSATGGEQPLADEPHQGADDSSDASAKKEEPAHDASAAGSDGEKPQGDAPAAPDGKTEENEAVPKKDSNEFDFSSSDDKTSDASGSAGPADADVTTEHAPASDASAAGSGDDSTAAAAPKSEDSTQSENVEREEHPEGTPETTNAPADATTTTTEAPHHDEEDDAGRTPVSETPIVPEEAHTVSPDNEGDKPEATTQAPHEDTTPHDDTAPHDDGAAHDNGEAPGLGSSGGDANGGDSTPDADGGDSAGAHPSGGNGGVTPSHEHRPHSHPHHDYGGRVPPTIEQLLAQLSPDTRRQYELDHGIIHPSEPEVPTNGGGEATHGDGEGDKPTDTGAPSFPGSTEGDSGHEQTTTTTEEPPAVDGDAAGSDSDFLGSKPPTAEPAPASPDDGADNGSEHKEPTDEDHATPSTPEGDSHAETTTPSPDSDGYGSFGGGDEHKNEGGDSVTEKPHEDTTTPPSYPAGGDEDDTKTNEVTESPKLTTFPTRYTTTQAPSPGDDDHHDGATTEAAPSVPSEAGSDAGSPHDEHHSGKDEPCGTVVSTKSEDTAAVKTHDPIVQLVKSGIPDLHLDGSEPHRDRRRSGRSH